MLKKEIMLEKTIDEIDYFKYKKPLWRDISFQNIAKESNYSYKNFMRIMKVMKEEKVDVVILNRASLKLIHQIYKHGVPVYVKDPLEERGFRMQKQKEYFDFQYYIEKERLDLRSFYGSWHIGKLCGG